MKKIILWTLILAALILPLCGIAVEDRRAKIEALVAEWKEMYGGRIGWEVFGLDIAWPNMDHLEVDMSDPEARNMQPIQSDEIPREEALALSLEAICDRHGVTDIQYFRNHEPLFGFLPDRIWTISLLPLDPVHDPDWSFWVHIDTKTGEILAYREGRPWGPGDYDDSDVPKG